MRGHPRIVALGLASALLVGAPPLAQAQAFRKIGELELRLLGVQASVDPSSLSVPKNVASAVRVVVRAGDAELPASEVARFLGAGFRVEGELSGPGLHQTLSLPDPLADEPAASDPLLLPLPALAVAGDYSLSNLRISANGRVALDVTPSAATLRVIDQILVTSVKTRPLTLDEIKAKGIVLDSDDYLAFEFTLGMKLESNPVNLSFPVVFDRRGVPVPQPALPPPVPARSGLPPTIVPMLLEAEPPSGPDGERGPRVPLTLPDGKPIRIPSLLVIPGNVGYLKQFFSAQLFVANGAPVGSGLIVQDITGSVVLPPGADLEPGTEDDPLALPDTVRGPQPATLPVRSIGADGQPDTGDDAEALAPAEQGQAEFLIRGEREGFHPLSFDISASLLGLPVGPVRVTGKAQGGVLVRNPYFDVSFTVPATVRRSEPFKFYVTVTNIGQGIGNDVSVTLDASRMSGAHLVGAGTQAIATLRQGDAATLAFDFVSDRTGQVVASYLRFDSNGGASGDLRFTLGVGERGVPLSPDTLVLPASLDALPQSVVDAAMRVLGQGWSLAAAPNGSLPAGVTRTSRTVVTERALALAEAGLRTTLGQAPWGAVRDLVLDWYGASPLDPGFDQLLRLTDAGHALALACGAALEPAVAAHGGPIPFEGALAGVAASGPDLITFAIGGAAGAVDATIVDGAGNRSDAGRTADRPASAVPGAVWLPIGPGLGPLAGVVGAPTGGPYTILLEGRQSGSVDISATLPRGDGTFARVIASGIPLNAGSRAALTLDAAQPDRAILRRDDDGDGVFESQSEVAASLLVSDGPHAVAASVIGPETLSGAGPFGLQAVLLLDRPVDAASAQRTEAYEIPDNLVTAARRQLSGRLVFLSLERPEGPYVPTTLSVAGLADARGSIGPAATLPLGSRLEDPGAVVAGHVLNADGTPVGGAVVTYTGNLDGANCESARYGGLAAQRVPADGSFELRYVWRDPCGAPFGLATHDPASGALRRVSSFVRTAGERLALDLVLLGRGGVAGRVLDLAGEPVPGARVHVSSVTDPQFAAVATSDLEGRYAVTGIAVGPVAVRAAAGASLGRAAGRIERAGTVATVDVTLDGGATSVAGTVRKLEGGVLSPLPGIDVVLSVPDGVFGSIALGLVRADAEGRYLFESTPAGAFSVAAALNQRDRASRAGIGVAGSPLTGFDLLIEVQDQAAYGTVRGTVRLSDGTPYAGAVVSIGDRGALSGQDGAYEIAGVPVRPTSSQQVSARSRDGKRRGQNAVTIAEPNQLREGVDVVLSGLGAAVFTVLDAAGQALANQEVALLFDCLDACGCRARTTAADGSVRFDDLPLGAIPAQAVRAGPGYVEAARATASITREGDAAFAVLRFGGAGVVTGSVLGPDGLPSFGADVALSATHFENDGGSTCGLVEGVAQRTRTDTSGRFRFSGVNVGKVAVSASQPFFPTLVGAQGTLSASGQTLDLTLRLVDTIAGELRGRVLLPDGATPAGGGIEVTASGPLPDVVVQTNAEGSFRFARVLPQGGYTLTVRDPVSGSVARQQVYLRAGEDASYDLRLLGRGSVVVRVVDGADSPVGQAFVKLRESQFPNRTLEGAIEASNQGALSLSNVFEGPFSVEARDSFGRGGRASGLLPLGAPSVELKVRLTTTGSLRGRFLMPDRQTPIPFGVVKLVAGSRELGRVTAAGSGEVGAFAFDYVPAGAIRLEAEDPLTARTGVAVGSLSNEGETLALDVVAQGIGVVEGSVLSNGAPQAGAIVDVVSGSFKARTSSAASGHYVVEGVPEGRVTVTASLATNVFGAAGFLAGTAQETLEGDGARLQLDVSLRDSGRVTGRVLAADGVTPAPPAVVEVAVGGKGGGQQSATSDAEGRFAFDRVAAGSASLTADVLSSIDSGSASGEVPAGGTLDVEIRLRGVGAIEGRALDSAGQPTAGDLRIAGFFIKVGSDGQYRLPEVAAGSFSAQLSARIGDVTLYGTAAGEVVPGETTVLDVQVQPSGTVAGRVVRGDGTTPATGADVRIELSGNRVVTLQAQADGGFSAVGVPLGSFDVRVTDAVTGGRALLAERALATNGETLELGTILLDASPPVIAFLQPADGTTRSAIGGPVSLSVADLGTGLDPASACLTYPEQRFTQCGLAVDLGQGRVSGNLDVGRLVVGVNTVVATVADLAGNVGEARLTYTATGGSVRGAVRRADGSFAPGVAVSISGAGSVTTDDTGAYVRGGLRPGAYTATATDPVTGLQASRNGTLFDGDELALDVTLPAFGSIAGVVRRSDGALAQGVLVTAGGRGATTDAGGGYRLDALPLGSYTIEASDPADGDRGRAAATIATLGQLAQADVTLNGIGALTVSVRSAGGAPVAGAAVTVDSRSQFGGHFAANADADGSVTFAQVFAGVADVQASGPAGVSGTTTALVVAGGAASATVTLEPAGRVAGSVRRHDGAAAAGVSVTISGAKSATTTSDGGGLFAFDGVRLGSFSLQATDPANGDRASGGGQMSVDGATVEVDLALNGVGEVRLLVQDAQGASVAGASVRADSGSPFGGSKSGLTGGDGRAVLANLLAGPISAQATHPTNGTRGTATGTLGAGGALDLTLTLEPLGTIAGVVREPDGVTPAPGVTVTLAARSMLTAEDGAFSFAEVRLGSYGLDASRNGRLRARVSGVVVAAADEVVERDLVLGGVGSVTGLVTDAGGAPAPAALVRITSPAPIGGGVLQATADAVGRYSIADVPLGSFSIMASRSVQKDRVDASGVVSYHGETLTLDLRLLANAVTLPASLSDGNRTSFRFVAAGTYTDGGNCGNYVAANRLTLVRDGVAATFAGSGNTITSEEAGRELVFVQEGLAGLSVTRKSFVPRDGYFVRHLELLRNDGAEPVTVDVVVQTDTGSSWPVAVADSASGDAALDAGDDWVTYDDGQGVVGVCDFAPTALAFVGPGGLRPSSASLTSPSASERIETRWNALTIPAGGELALLGVMTRQGDLDRARASAQRLAGLPPELLAGLEPEEAAAIVNFVVPADLLSALPALPPNDGQVIARVLGGDGETLVPGATVKLQLRSPHYYAEVSTVSAAGGSYRFAADLAANPPVLIPREAFDLVATYSSFGPRTASAVGAFPTSGVADLTNMIGRTLRTSSSGPAGVPGPFRCCNAELAVDGDVDSRWTTATGDAASPPANGTPYFEILFPTQVSVHEVRIQGMRGLGGGDAALVRRARVEVVDAAGGALFAQDLELPLPLRDLAYVLPAPVAGARSVRVTSLADSGSTAGFGEIAVLGEGLVGPGQRASADVVFTGMGVLAGRVLRADASPLSGAALSVRHASGGSANTVSNASGAYVYPVLPPAAFTLTATHPLGGSTASAGVVGVADTRLEQDLVFAPTGTVAGRVRTAANAPVSVQVNLEAPGFFRALFSSLADGTFTFPEVPEGAFTVSANDSRLGAVRSEAVTVSAGATSDATITFLPVGRVDASVTVAAAPLAGATVRAESPDRGAGFYRTCTTSAAGLCSLTNVAGTTVRVRAEYPGQAASFAEIVVPLATEAAVVPVSLDVPGVGTVSGVVRARNGVSLPSPAASIVSLRNPATGAQIAGPVATDAAGRYTFANRPLGPVRVRVQRENYFKGEASGEIASHGSTLELDVVEPRSVLATSDQRDLWEMDVTAGAPIDVRLDGVAVGADPALADPYLEVYGPDGVLAGANDDRATGDKGSRVAFTAAAAGRYAVVATGRAGAGGGYRLGSDRNDEVHVFRPWAGATVSGSVTREGDGMPLADLSLSVTREGVLVATTSTGPDGRYLLPFSGGGEIAVEAQDAAAVTIARSTAVVSTPGDSAVVDLVAPARGIVRSTVTRGGLPVPGLAVAFASDHPTAFAGDAARAAVTDAQGVATTPLPVGTVVATVLDPLGGGSFSVQGVLGADATLALELSLGAPPAAIRGHVLAADGLTPLAGAILALSRDGSQLATAVADTTGAYEFAGLAAGSYTIDATYAGAAGAVSVSGAATLAGVDQVVDLVSTAKVLSGLVTATDGSPVFAGTVRACRSAACVEGPTAPDGRYLFVGLPAWTHGATITVDAWPDDASTVVGRATFTFFTLPTAFTRDVVLPPTGTVWGTVRQAEGQAASQASVTLVAPSGSVVRSTTADAMGTYAFSYVRPQELTVVATDGDGIPGLTSVVVTDAAVIQADVDLMPTANLTVHVVGVDGEDLFDPTPVLVEALEAPRLGGQPWSRSDSPVTEGGVWASFRVPAGAFRVTAGGGPFAAGDGVLAAGVEQTVELRLGSHEERLCCEPYVTTSVPGLDPFPDLVETQLGGRATRSLLTVGSGARARRLELRSADARFLRTLTLFGNPGTSPLALEADSRLSLEITEEDAEGWLVADSSSGDAALDTADSWVVLQPPASSAEPYRALVFGDALAPSSAWFDGGGPNPDGWGPGSVVIQHSLAVPPGETRGLLLFAAQATSLAEARQLAVDMALLAPADALEGLSPLERLSITNFALPPATGATGIARAAGGSLLAGARVAATAAGAIAAEATSDEVGRYLLLLPPGDYGIVALDPGSGRPGRTDVTVGAGSLATADVVVLSPEGLGSVEVRAAPAALADGAGVRLSVGGYSPVWSAEATFDADGRAGFPEAPPGLVVARAFRGLTGQASAELVAGASAVIDLAVAPDLLASISGSVVLGLQPVANARVGIVREPGGEIVVEARSAADGSFLLEGIAAGSYAVVARDPATGFLAARLRTVAEGERVTGVSLSLEDWRGAGSIRAQVVDGFTGAPIGGAIIDVDLLGYGAVSRRSGVSDGNGWVVIDQVPEGEVWIHAGAPPVMGSATGYVNFGAVLELTLRVADGHAFLPIDLTGADGQPFFAWGPTVRGSSMADAWCQPFCAGYSEMWTDSEYLALPDRTPLGRARLGGREVVLQAAGTGGLRGERRVFVPASGRFARVVDVIENATGVAQTVSWYAENSQETASGAPCGVTGTTDGDASFDPSDSWVSLACEGSAEPLTAFVVSDAASAALRTWSSAGGEPGWAWADDQGSLLLQPGETAILIRFAVQRPNGDADGLAAQVQALADLSLPTADPEALYGLTPEERALVRNFVVPQP
ncbi:MAG: carboxypeptidase regulatory-like domain-containing protein [Vicinamibacteria bacterium]